VKSPAIITLALPAIGKNETTVDVIMRDDAVSMKFTDARSALDAALLAREALAVFAVQVEQDKLQAREEAQASQPPAMTEPSGDSFLHESFLQPAPRADCQDDGSLPVGPHEKDDFAETELGRIATPGGIANEAVESALQVDETAFAQLAEALQGVFTPPVSDLATAPPALTPEQLQEQRAEFMCLSARNQAATALKLKERNCAAEDIVAITNLMHGANVNLAEARKLGPPPAVDFDGALCLVREAWNTLHRWALELQPAPPPAFFVAMKGFDALTD
jgi:hypothetical protein